MANFSLGRSHRKELIRRAHRYGYFWEPGREYQDTRNVSISDLDSLDFGDTEVKQAFRAWQNRDANFDVLMRRHHPDRPTTAVADDEIGPATVDLAELPRCAIPDNPPLTVSDASFVMDEFGSTDIFEATGSGSWSGLPDGEPVGCDPFNPDHQQQYHSVRLSIDTDGMPRKIKQYYERAKKAIQECMRQKGLAVRFVSPNEPAELRLAFKFIRGGVIGYFYVLNQSTCKLTLTGKLDTDYAPSQWLMWSTLAIHEALGHGIGFGHSRGGIMNPSIIRPNTDSQGNPSWINDPFESRIDQFFGGEVVPLVTADDPDEPPEPPTPGIEIVSSENVIAIGEKRFKVRLIEDADFS